MTNAAQLAPVQLTHWNVDYGDGVSEPIEVPHSWGRELEVLAEGPVVYRTLVEVPTEGAYLVFHGVSYEAQIKVEGESVGRHEGIWDAFSVSLASYAGKAVEVEVSVLKNGGPTYPVDRVASGFLPYLFGTFGGLFREVDLVAGSSDPLEHTDPPPRSRMQIVGNQLRLDGRPFYMRGLLHWGWYPELGHPNPGFDAIREEVRAVKELGFNTVKFCLWLPPHRYLEILQEENMFAWIELPIWLPSPDCDYDRLALEMERIVRQYRRHDCIGVWTIGCELGGRAPYTFRQRMTSLVRSLTGCPLVRDDSGGAEMYGGDPREYGSFFDFHPYCDTQFFPGVLDALLPGPRADQPMLLGEFNDVDVHRDLFRLTDDQPYWGSLLTEINAQGVRWQYDLPRVLNTSLFAHDPEESGHDRLMSSSLGKAEFIRKTVGEAVRARDPIGGYVITGWRDTPVSSSGFFDDWGRRRFSRASVSAWNEPTCLFLIPSRQTPWINGGNRRGTADPHNVFVGANVWRIGIHADHEVHGGGLWRLYQNERLIGEGAIEPTEVAELRSVQIAEVFADIGEAGKYRLHVEFGGARNDWQITAVERGDLPGVLFTSEGVADFLLEAPVEVRALSEFSAEGPAVLVLTDQGTTPAPFWREAAYQYLNESFWASFPWQDEWERWLPISGDRVLDPAWLDERSPGWEPLMVRVDTRTYHETPILARIGPKAYVTTIRPFGGLGDQPYGLARNPSGQAFLRELLSI